MNNNRTAHFNGSWRHGHDYPNEGTRYSDPAPPAPNQSTNGPARYFREDDSPADLYPVSNREFYKKGNGSSYPLERPRAEAMKAAYTRHVENAKRPFTSTERGLFEGGHQREMGYRMDAQSTAPRERGYSFEYDERPDSRRSITTAPPRADYEITERSPREWNRSSVPFGGFSYRPETSWKPESRGSRSPSRPNTSSSSIVPQYPPRRSVQAVYERPGSDRIPSYTPHPAVNNENYQALNPERTPKFEERRPIRPLPTGPRAQLVSQFPSRSPSIRPIDMPPAASFNGVHARSPKRYSPPPFQHVEDVREPANQRSSHEGNGQNYAGGARDPYVPNQSPQRVESLRESLARAKPRTEGNEREPRIWTKGSSTSIIRQSPKRVTRFDNRRIADEARIDHMIGKLNVIKKTRQMPILSPKARVLHALPSKPLLGSESTSQSEEKLGYFRPSGTGKAPPTAPRFLREQAKRKSVMPAPNADISASNGGAEAEAPEDDKASDDGGSSIASTPRPPPTDDDRASEDYSSYAETPLSPLEPSWHKISTTLRAALTRVLVNERPHQDAVVRRIKKKVADENRVTVQSHDPKQRGPYIKYQTDPSKPKASREEVAAALAQRFRIQETALKNKVWNLKKEYKRLSKKWERYCQVLDEQNPPEEVAPVAVPETPLTARTGRRNRAGLSDMIHSEFDLEQFVQKQVESDKVDAELLGRMNAAEVPDMISVTKERWHRYTHNDTNSLVRDAQEFYDYWAMDAWTEDEQIAFRQMLGEVGKKFGVIAANPALHHRTVQDCVRFYYRSKADEKYRHLLRGVVKKGGKRSESRGVPSASDLGGLLADIRAGESRRKGGREDETRESSESAYEQEQRTNPCCRTG